MPGKPDDVWSVYMIRRNDGKIYTGITTDVERRFEEHKEGKTGARFLRGMGPLELLTSMEVGTRGKPGISKKKSKSWRRIKRKKRQNTRKT